MNDLEDRLRDAYHRAADSVRPEHIPGPPWARDQNESPVRARPTWRRLTPVAAAVAVAVIAVSSAIVLPHVLSDTGAAPGASPSASGPLAPAPVYSVPAGAPPKFIVVVPDDAGAPAPLEVRDAATGRVVSTVPAPQANTAWAIVTAVTSDTFILAAEPENGPAAGSCYTLLYSLKLTAAGAPSSLKPLDVPQITGYVSAGDLVASADGTVAYASEQCPATITSMVTIATIDTGTAQTTRWTIPSGQFLQGGLALSADGQELALGFANNNYVPVSGNHSTSMPYFAPSVWLLRTDSTPGLVKQRAHRVVTLSGESQLNGALLISADGSTVYVVTDYSQTAKQIASKLAAYDVATGALLHVVRTGWHLIIQAICADPAVDHALVWGAGSTEPVEIDLATGQVRTPAASLPSGQSVASAAW